ncbi:hypothetical protein AC579_3053 [Pseudocercospora musae]|uniref:Uncharacterized protein n=1 Tax=Pseudocercospora musae TaxID=113226 RepID=A0A139IK20_9PEZI|nr:hypothetical protein AC579_3053 [Pseudocercospora musae]
MLRGSPAVKQSFRDRTLSDCGCTACHIYLPAYGGPRRTTLRPPGHLICPMCAPLAILDGGTHHMEILRVTTATLNRKLCRQYCDTIVNKNLARPKDRSFVGVENSPSNIDDVSI